MLSFVLTLAAVPVFASDIAGLKNMESGGAAAQSSAFTGENASDAPVSAAASAGTHAGRVTPSAKPVPVVATPPPPPSDGRLADRKRARNLEKAWGTGAILVGGFWMAMGIGATTGTVAMALPIAAGILAIGIGIQFWRGKIKL